MRPCAKFLNVVRLMTVLWLLGGSSRHPGAADQALDINELLKQGQQWAQENLDPQWLNAFNQLDQKQINDFLVQFQKRFQGEYVLDLAQLRSGAKVVLPLLDSHPETKPYSSWLRARMDYLEAAEELRLLVQPPQAPKPTPDVPPKPLPNPTPAQQNIVWQKRVSVQAPPQQKGYAPRLKPIFASAKVPQELVWLAEIESSFDPQARSPVGATGLYQLMPATAQEQGLSLKPRDERLDPEKNARAAAKYLRHLHGRFGDWPLALAAYNAGEGRVNNLLQKHKANSFERIASKLPAETQMYVPRFDATLRKREGMTLAQLNKRSRGGR